MKRFRKQRVVMRFKVRKAYWKSSVLILGKLFLVGSALLLLGYGAMVGNHFLNKNEYFLIKSISIQPEGKASLIIGKEISSLKGKSIWSADLRKFRKRLLRSTPELRAIKIARAWPDRIRVKYELRRSIAKVKGSVSGKVKKVDEEGVLFTQRLGEATQGNLPELEFNSKKELNEEIAFLKLWTKRSQIKIGRLTLNRWGELEVELVSLYPNHSGTKVIWGGFDPKTFDEKKERLNMILEDLKSKSLHAEVVRLSDVLVSQGFPREGGQIMGRAFVQVSKASS